MSKKKFIAMVAEGCSIESAMSDLRSHGAEITEVHYVLDGIMGTIPDNVDLGILKDKLGLQSLEEDASFKDESESDWTSVLIEAIGHLLEPGTGVIVNNYLVSSDGENVHISDFNGEEGLESGDIVDVVKNDVVIDIREEILSDEKPCWCTRVCEFTKFGKCKGLPTSIL